MLQNEFSWLVFGSLLRLGRSFGHAAFKEKHRSRNAWRGALRDDSQNCGEGD